MEQHDPFPPHLVLLQKKQKDVISMVGSRPLLNRSDVGHRFTNRMDWLIIFPTIIGFILRIYHLGFKSLWLDEAVIYWISQNNLGSIIFENARLNSTPPLYVLLLHFLSIAGQSESVLRSISMVAGVATIPSIFILAKKVVPTNAALLCGLFIAVAPVQVKYSQELREYSLAILLSIWIIYFYLMFEEQNQPGWLLGYTISSSFAIFTQYGIAFLLFAINLTFGINLIKSGLKYNKLLMWCLSQLIILAFVGIVYFTSLKYQFVPGGFGAFYLSKGYWNPGDSGYASLISFFFTNASQILNFIYPISLILWGIMLLAAALNLKGSKERITLTLIGAFTGLGIFLGGVTHFYPFIADRQILFISPVLYILMAIGVDKLITVRPKYLWAAIMIVVIGFVGVKGTLDYLKSPGAEELRPIVETLKSEIKPSDLIYVYYTSEPAFRYYFQNSSEEIIVGIKSRDNPESYFSQLSPFLKGHQRIWLVFSHCVLGECEKIVNFAGSLRYVVPIRSESGASLFLVN